MQAAHSLYNMTGRNMGQSKKSFTDSSDCFSANDDIECIVTNSHVSPYGGRNVHILENHTEGAKTSR